MARDLDVQKEGVIPAGGLHVDIGYIDFSSGSASKDADIMLSQVDAALCIAQKKDAGNQTLVATTDGDITSGQITFRREGPYISEDARFYYILFGV